MSNFWAASSASIGELVDLYSMISSHCLLACKLYRHHHTPTHRNQMRAVFLIRMRCDALGSRLRCPQITAQPLALARSGRILRWCAFSRNGTRLRSTQIINHVRVRVCVCTRACVTSFKRKCAGCTDRPTILLRSAAQLQCLNEHTHAHMHTGQTHCPTAHYARRFSALLCMA